MNVMFADNSIGKPISWTWSFGDGKTPKSQNPAHTYKNAGTYTVSLTVKDKLGTKTTTKSNLIIVKNTLLIANFSASPITGKQPLTVQFTDSSTGSPTSWKWDFGDGKTSREQNPEHKYNKAGNYTVSLKVKNAAGSDTKRMVNYIIVKKK